MLDSSPVALPSVALPPVARLLKRSASTASLPSPPRTNRRYERGMSRGSCDSDSDGDVAILSSDDEQRDTSSNQHKKRRVKGPEAEEDAFWLGTGPSGVEEMRGRGREPAGLRTRRGRGVAGGKKGKGSAPLVYRKREAAAALAAQSSITTIEPVSPPPSHRKHQIQAVPGTPPQATTSTKPLIKFGWSSSPPTTPKTRSATRKAAAAASGGVFRDSPENPFLVSPDDGGNATHVEDSATPSPGTSANPSPKTPTGYREKPTITYVFRGVRREFQNPLYNQDEDRPYSPPPQSKLPMDHPDYSPALHVTPKLLFPESRRAKGKGKGFGLAGPSNTKLGAAKPKKGRQLADSDDEFAGRGDDEDDLDLAKEVKPTKLNFASMAAGVGAAGRATTRSKKPSGGRTLAQEFKGAGENVKT